VRDRRLSTFVHTNCAGYNPLRTEAGQIDASATTARHVALSTRIGPLLPGQSEGLLHETKTWRRAARALKIARADIELTGAAFSESDA
jgi:hypothetical protein